MIKLPLLKGGEEVLVNNYKETEADHLEVVLQNMADYFKDNPDAFKNLKKEVVKGFLDNVISRFLDQFEGSKI